MIGEFELIARITEGLEVNSDVVLSVGDDSAVVALQGDTVVCTDILIENVHFKRQWSPAHAVGRKAVAVNVSDLEAMGCRPSSVVVALAFPKDLNPQWVVDFEQGVRDECVAAGVSLIGGDMSRSEHIVACVTASGDTMGRTPVTRGGAQPGDSVAIRGNLGLSGAGLVVLQRGFGSPKDAVAEHLTPSVQYGQGLVAADAGATAMIDVSDGLLADLGHVSEQSGVRIDVDTSLLKVPDPVARVAAATGKPAIGFLLAGGEDHSLAATFPAGTDLPDGWVRIGEVREGEGVTVDGEAYDGERGWDHFG